MIDESNLDKLLVEVRAHILRKQAEGYDRVERLAPMARSAMAQAVNGDMTTHDACNIAALLLHVALAQDASGRCGVHGPLVDGRCPVCEGQREGLH